MKLRLYEGYDSLHITACDPKEEKTHLETHKMMQFPVYCWLGLAVTVFAAIVNKNEYKYNLIKNSNTTVNIPLSPTNSLTVWTLQFKFSFSVDDPLKRNQKKHHMIPWKDLKVKTET